MNISFTIVFTVKTNYNNRYVKKWRKPISFKKSTSGLNKGTKRKHLVKVIQIKQESHFTRYLYCVFDRYLLASSLCNNKEKEKEQGK